MKYLAIYMLLFSLIKLTNAQEESLKIGDEAPDFFGNTHTGDTINLKACLKKGPVVLTFYRGEWCPYCNKYLARLDEIYPQIQEAGANLIAISPEVPKYTSKMADEMQHTYPIIADTGYTIMKQFGVDFTLAKKKRLMYKAFGINLKKHNGDDTYTLPVPATYVIDSNSKIVYQHYDENYKERGNINEILKTLQQLKLKKEEKQAE